MKMRRISDFLGLNFTRNHTADMDSTPIWSSYGVVAIVQGCDPASAVSLRCSCAPGFNPAVPTEWSS
jgi:hypothetical protein